MLAQLRRRPFFLVPYPPSLPPPLRSATLCAASSPLRLSSPSMLFCFHLIGSSIFFPLSLPGRSGLTFRQGFNWLVILSFAFALVFSLFLLPLLHISPSVSIGLLFPIVSSRHLLFTQLFCPFSFLQHISLSASTCRVFPPGFFAHLIYIALFGNLTIRFTKPGGF